MYFSHIQVSHGGQLRRQLGLYDVDPSFGTPDDFEKLKARPKELGEYEVGP
jgi:hypothetical protein